MQKLLQRPEVPPNRFNFTCPETGWKTEELSLSELFRKVEKHYKENNLSLPDNWKDIVENRICEGLPPGWCEFTDGSPSSGHLCAVTGEMIIHGVQSLAKLVWESFKGKEVFVPQEESEKRAEICSKCHLNVDTNVCMGCGAMAEMLDKTSNIRKNRTTKWDHMLKNCCICGCRNDTIVHIRNDILQTGESSDITSRYPSWCWKVNNDLNDSFSKLKL